MINSILDVYISSVHILIISHTLIHEVFNLLKDQLNTYFKTIGQVEDKVVFIDTKQNEDTIKFTHDKITPILINIEEERIMRPPELYAANMGQAIKMGNFPEIRINLLTLFVARFGDYAQGLNFLSHVIKFFQINRVFDHTNTPTLSPDIEKLVMELTPPVLQEQDAVWNALRTSYLPSVLYKVKMLVYLDQESLQVASSVSGIDMKINQADTSSNSATEIPVEDDDMAVDYNTSAVVEIIDSDKDVIYQLYADGMPSGNPQTSAADGDTVTLTSAQLIADTTFSIKATLPDGGEEVWLDTLIQVAVRPRTEDITIEPSPETEIDYGNTATIQLNNAQPGVRYQLQANGVNNGAYVDCTTDTQSLSLISDPVTQDTDFTVKATSTGNGQSVTLDGSVSVTVDYENFSINTSLQLSGPPIPIVNHNRYVTITVASSEKGVQYQLKDGDTSHGDPVPGTGGSIELSSNPLTADTTFTVEASLINDNTNKADLSQAVTVMVGRLQFGEGDNAEVQAAMSLLRAKNIITRPYTTVARLRINKRISGHYAKVNRLSLQKAAGGQGSYIELTNSNILWMTGNQTIEMWIKPDSPAGNGVQYLYFNGKPLTSGSIYIDDDGYIVYEYDTDNGQVKLAARDPLSTGTWIHIAVTRNSIDGALQWYINGTPDTGKTTADIPGTKTSTKESVIGGNPGQDSYIGMIAEVRIWNAARTEDEIKNNMGKRLEDPPGNLVAYWKLDEGNVEGISDETTAVDTSVSGLDGEIHGAQWI